MFAVVRTNLTVIQTRVTKYDQSSHSTNVNESSQGVITEVSTKVIPFLIYFVAQIQLCLSYHVHNQPFIRQSTKASIRLSQIA